MSKITVGAKGLSLLLMVVDLEYWAENFSSTCCHGYYRSWKNLESPGIL